MAGADEADSSRNREWFLQLDTLKPIRLIELASSKDKSARFHKFNLIDPVPGSEWESRLGNIVSAVRRGDLVTDRIEGWDRVGEELRPARIDRWQKFAKERKQGDWEWLRDFCAEWSKRAQTPLDTETPIGAKERNSYLTLIIAMAVEKYGYNPRDERTDATADIRAAAEDLGLKIDPKTIRKYLEAAADLVESDHWSKPG